MIPVPFLTNRFLTTPEEVERLYRPLGWLPSPPPVQPSVPVSRDVPASPTPVVAEPSRPLEALAATPPVSVRQSGLTVQLDINVERRRSWWWRLALSLVVRRLCR